MSEKRPDVFGGTAWILRGESGRLLDSVDTDQIYHNAHLAVTEIGEMGRHALGNLRGWEDFPQKVKPGDVLVAGDNFGAGSSRQHAVDCFVALGVAAIVAKSFAPIYKRNAINSGFPILACPCLSGSAISDQQAIRVEFRRGEIRDAATGQTIAACSPPSNVQLQIYEAGGLFSYGSRMAYGSEP
jgi:3-isopropylmalate/(R)-2-methylmalate dehydratase small subunit